MTVLIFGKNALLNLMDGFSCPPNTEVEHFLKHSSIEFTKKNQSAFYAENGFKAFDRRTVTPSDNEPPHELVQLLRFL